MANIDYGNSVKGELFRTIHELCEEERDVSMDLSLRQVQWTADPDIFEGGSLRLNPAGLEHLDRYHAGFLLKWFSLELDGGDTRLSVKRDDLGTLNEDMFAVDILENVKAIVSHPHELCLEAMRQRREAALVGKTYLTGLRAATSGKVIR